MLRLRRASMVTRTGIEVAGELGGGGCGRGGRGSVMYPVVFIVGIAIVFDLRAFALSAVAETVCEVSSKYCRREARCLTTGVRYSDLQYLSTFLTPFVNKKNEPMSTGRTYVVHAISSRCARLSVLQGTALHSLRRRKE